MIEKKTREHESVRKPKSVERCSIKRYRLMKISLIEALDDTNVEKPRFFRGTTSQCEVERVKLQLSV